MDSDADEIAKIAQSLLPAARALAGRAPVPVEDLMQEAITLVGPWRERTPPITNLPAYLFTTYKHLLWDHLQRTQHEVKLSESDWQRLGGTNPLQAIEAKILVEELVQRLKEEDRFIFDCLAQQYSYREITEMYERRFGTRIEENALRSRYSKAVKRLAQEISSNNPEK